jgi:hypothetical protein
VADSLPPELRQAIDSKGDDVPTPELVHRALRVVHDVVGVAESTFETYASDAAVMRHRGSRGTT